ncbi:hypothetical protein D3C73_867420 [compost metagenome]
MKIKVSSDDCGSKYLAVFILPHLNLVITLLYKAGVFNCSGRSSVEVVSALNGNKRKAKPSLYKYLSKPLYCSEGTVEAK